MKIKRAELLEALNIVEPGVATNAVIEQMGCILFTGQDMITFNNQVAVLYPFDTEFEVAINHADLKNIVTKIKKDEIEFVMGESELLITTKTTKAGLVPLTTEDIDESIDSLISQLPNEENDLEWQDLPDGFIDGALLCAPAAAHDLSQGPLACLYINNSNLVCGDNQRISWYEMNKPIEGDEFFIRAGVVGELAKFNVKQLCVSDSWANFVTDDNVIFSTKLVKGKSIEYFTEMFAGFKGNVIALPEGLREIVEAAAVMAEDTDTKDMQISIQKGEMICATQNNRGWVEKTIPLKYDKKKPVELFISAKFLQQILNLPLKMTVGKDRSMFQSGQFKHMLIHKVREEA